MQNIDLVVKIGSMALIQKEDSVIDYNVFQRLAMALRPGMILVSSGATEIGRLDYIQRTGHELTGEKEQIKVDYSAQGQSILMNNYRTFIRPEYGVRQVLVEPISTIPSGGSTSGRCCTGRRSRTPFPSSTTTTR